MSSFGQDAALMTHGSTAALERFGPMRRYDPETEVDAVVIGTGAGGAPVLARLAAAGLRVVALEAGPAGTRPATSPPTSGSRANCSGGTSG